MDRVKGKVAIVTGGGKGLGRATALLLAAEGARLVITDVDVEAGETARAELRQAGAEAIFLQQDITDEARWQEVIATTIATYGALDILVNNAGIGFPGTAETTSYADWKKMISVDLDGVFLGTQQAILAMKARGGSIVNISSIEGIIANPSLAAYNAAKGGVRIFTKSAALHCAKSGYRIRVNSVHPGYILTTGVKEFFEKFADGPEHRKAIEALHPVGHMGEPDDIAYGVLYLASDESKFVTGSELVIDGGYTAQ